MPQRTTRNKVRYAARRVIDSLDECFVYLKHIDELNEEQSPDLSNKTAAMVVMLESVREVARDFRESL